MNKKKIYISRREFITGAGIATAAVFLTACKAQNGQTLTTSSPTTSTTTEVEATQFMGQKLTPIKQQNNNAILGTQNIDRAIYNLTVDGLVNNPLTLTYDDLLAYPQISKLVSLNCVEGWIFTAKWTGLSLGDIFTNAGIKPEATIAIFHTNDDSNGFTSLDVSYLQNNNIIIALKDNDVTLPAERGFPLRVVADGKYGYKWAKWVTRIELSDNTSFLGYWEGYGYSNNGDINS